MKELFMIGVGAALINNVVLSQFLVSVPFLVYPGRQERQQEWAQQSFLSSPCRL